MKTILFFSLWCLFLFSPSLSASTPNILFVLTDDQDVTANSLDYMPNLGRIFRKEGMEFLNYFVTTALCCPSRSTIIKGQYCHNTGIWDNGDLNNSTFQSGGFAKWIEEGLHNTTIATMIQSLGYETFLIGKYLNGYSDAHADVVPPGWDYWHGMTDTAYYGPHFSDNGKLLKVPKEVYQTDYISETATTLLKKRSPNKPFFMYLSPFAPHAPSIPAHRHENLFNDKQAPRTVSFNPDDKVQKEKPSWLGRLPKLTDKQIESIDNFYRNRLRALQAVDEMLVSLEETLKGTGEWENTYVFYMGDNGQHLGDYRLPGGKRQAYDTDIRVPFLVRGPGIKGGLRVTEIVQNIDLMPTWVNLAGGEIPSTYVSDGKSIVPLLSKTGGTQPAVNEFRSVSLAEMYGGSSNMGGYSGMPGYEKGRFWNNTYQAIRVINGSDWASGANWLYAQWCTGESEFYDSDKDPRQVSNTIADVSSAQLAMLSNLVSQLGNCKGAQCHSVDYVQIRREVENGVLKKPTWNLPCHNPPDMKGRDASKFWETADVDGLTVEECSFVLSDGLSYSDDEVVPEPYLSVWNKCQHNM